MTPASKRIADGRRIFASDKHSHGVVSCRGVITPPVSRSARQARAGGDRDQWSEQPR